MVQLTFTANSVFLDTGGGPPQKKSVVRILFLPPQKLPPFPPVRGQYYNRGGQKLVSFINHLSSVLFWQLHVLK